VSRCWKDRITVHAKTRCLRLSSRRKMEHHPRAPTPSAFQFPVSYRRVSGYSGESRDTSVSRARVNLYVFIRLLTSLTRLFAAIQPRCSSSGLLSLRGGPREIHESEASSRQRSANTRRAARQSDRQRFGAFAFPTLLLDAEEGALSRGLTLRDSSRFFEIVADSLVETRAAPSSEISVLHA